MMNTGSGNLRPFNPQEGYLLVIEMSVNITIFMRIQKITLLYSITRRQNFLVKFIPILNFPTFQLFRKCSQVEGKRIIKCAVTPGWFSLTLGRKEQPSILRCTSLPYRDSRVKCNEFSQKRKWKMSPCMTAQNHIPICEQLKPSQKCAGLCHPTYHIVWIPLHGTSIGLVH